jgi:hypothetical protein
MKETEDTFSKVKNVQVVVIADLSRSGFMMRSRMPT